MRTSPEGIDWIKQRESLRLAAYQDGGGVWTIGYGHTEGVKKGQTITPAQALRFLALDLPKYEAAVTAHAPSGLAQCEFDALVSFAFNCGVGAPAQSTAFKKLVLGDRRGFARNHVRWCKDSGQYEEGLAMRRAEEVYQFMGGKR